MEHINIIVQKATTFEREIKFVNEDGTTVDLNGFSAAMQIRDQFNNELIVELTEENGRIIFDHENNIIKLHVEAKDLEDISQINGVYDLKLFGTLTSGEIFVARELRGNVMFIDEVTR